jgi:hypothetical protein
MVGHRLVQGCSVLYRQATVCELTAVALQSTIERMETLIREFEPVADTQTHVLLDRWYGATGRWRAARERDVLITWGFKSIRWLRVPDETARQGRLAQAKTLRRSGGLD